ncbi:MAG TPA: hypothetical protein VI727_11005 [Candidatus Brocadiaceae bacterium]|nr:hypothetical protein [Candidatus Brocadiaceae bacterium]
MEMGKGFELADGLPFVATDKAIHEILNAHTVAEAQALQIALGKILRASGHYNTQVLAIDPHRIPSYSKRQMRRHQHDKGPKPSKLVLVETGMAQIFPHFNEDKNRSHFDLLVQLPNQPALKKKLKNIPHEQFVPGWAGFATHKSPYNPGNGNLQMPLYQITQRCGEKPDQYQYKAFLSTADREEVDDLTLHYPSRWHVEEFFNANQALGWDRAGTTNINIRYGHMTLALIAQASIHQLRQRLGKPIVQWDARHLAKSLFNGLDGDIRVTDDTIIITYYNAPNVHLLKKHYEYLPQKLMSENVDPRIPWLYNFKLDSRFK